MTKKYDRKKLAREVQEAAERNGFLALVEQFTKVHIVIDFIRQGRGGGGFIEAHCQVGEEDASLGSRDLPLCQDGLFRVLRWLERQVEAEKPCCKWAKTQKKAALAVAQCMGYDPTQNFDTEMKRTWIRCPVCQTKFKEG